MTETVATPLGQAALVGDNKIPIIGENDRKPLTEEQQKTLREMVMKFQQKQNETQTAYIALGGYVGYLRASFGISENEAWRLSRDGKFLEKVPDNERVDAAQIGPAIEQVPEAAPSTTQSASASVVLTDAQ